MINLRRFACAIISLIAVLGLSACSKHDSDEHYYLITANTQIPYWQSAAAGFYKAAEQMKVHAEVAGPDSYDPQVEKVEFDKAVQKKPSGILVSAGDAELLRPSIDAAVAAGIPVITIDSDSPLSKRLFFVGTNNYDAGVRGGELAAKQLHGKGNVVIFTMPSQANLNARLRGYQKVFESYPQIKIDRIVDMKGDPRLVFDETQRIIDKKEPIDGIICLEAQGGKEVAAVLNNNHVAGKLVVAMDTDDDTLDWVRKGVIEATIAQKPFTMGYFGMQMLDDFHHNRMNVSDANAAENPNAALPTFVDTGSTLINKSNVDGVIEAQQNSKQRKG